MLGWVAAQVVRHGSRDCARQMMSVVGEIERDKRIRVSNSVGSLLIFHLFSSVRAHHWCQLEKRLFFMSLFFSGEMRFENESFRMKCKYSRLQRRKVDFLGLIFIISYSKHHFFTWNRSRTWITRNADNIVHYYESNMKPGKIIHYVPNKKS
jgi:hypothetical protein